jgi:(p)ppGpp synthase/HD superfamily hydrolase
MTLGQSFDEALILAVELHRDDVRKGKRTPYAAHVLGVCALVLQDGGNEDEAIGALLHDALEDHPDEISAKHIEKRFGQAVLEIVRSCTDTPPNYTGGPKPAWRKRKEEYLNHLDLASPSARRVSLADKVYNIRELVDDLRIEGDATWERFNAGRDDQLWYYREIQRRMHDAGQAGMLMREFDAAFAELDRLALGGSPA